LAIVLNANPDASIALPAKIFPRGCAAGVLPGSIPGSGYERFFDGLFVI